MKNSKEAFLVFTSTGNNAPTGKGDRLIISHVDSDSEFVEGGLRSPRNGWRLLRELVL